MKYIIFFTTMILIGNCSNKMSQKTNNYPKQKKDVSDEAYKYGTKVLKDTYHSINLREGEILGSDYWNFAVAYTYLKEDKEKVKEYINKSFETDQAIFAAAVKIKPDMAMKWKPLYSEEEYSKMFESSILEDLDNSPPKTVETVKLETVEFGEGLDEELVKIMHRIGEDDQKYRAGKDKNYDLQIEVDKRNLATIDSLFEVHQKYIGRSMVGKKYESVMWLVIQHSSQETMEKYLPVIHKAVEENELADAPLCLLLDRIYANKFNYQIFGTQYSEPKIPIGNDEIVDEVAKKYGLEHRKNMFDSNNNVEEQQEENKSKLKWKNGKLSY